MKLAVFIIFLIIASIFAQDDDSFLSDETKQKLAQHENSLSPEAKSYINQIKDAFMKNKEQNGGNINAQDIEAEVGHIRESLANNPTLQAEIEQFDKDVSGVLEADPNMGENLKRAREMAESTTTPIRAKRQESTTQEGMRRFHKPTQEQMDAIDKEITALQQTNPTAGKVAADARDIMRNESLYPKDKMTQIKALRESQKDPAVLTAIQDFEEKVKAIMRGTTNQ